MSQSQMAATWNSRQGAAAQHSLALSCEREDTYMCIMAHILQGYRTINSMLYIHTDDVTAVLAVLCMET